METLSLKFKDDSLNLVKLCFFKELFLNSDVFGTKELTIAKIV